uniref:peptidyl-tRNA hydrolase n=2 Tax=Chenopodium quinoa TaxID=63459 RepID=A0A803LXT6_CHEQI
MGILTLPSLVRLKASIPLPARLNLLSDREKAQCFCKSGLQNTQLTATATRRRMSADATVDSSETAAAEDVVVQYVVLRRDLIDTWPLGSVVTQGCHASVAAIWEHKDDPSTLLYCSPPALDSMHKVTLEVKGETQIVNLSEKLKSAGILHKLWIEQPENYPTCLATKPYPKSVVSPFFRKLKLCK